MSEKLLQQILKEMGEFRSEVLTRVDSLEKEMRDFRTDISARVEGLEKETRQLVSRVDALENRVDALEREMRDSRTEVVGRITVLEVEVKGMREEHGTILRKLEERTAVTNATLTRLAEDMDHLKGEVAGLVKRVDAHDIEIKVIKKAVANW